MLTESRLVKYECLACQFYSDHLVYKNGLAVCPDCASNWTRSEQLLERQVELKEFKRGIDPELLYDKVQINQSRI